VVGLRVRLADAPTAMRPSRMLLARPFAHSKDDGRVSGRIWLSTTGHIALLWPR